MTLQQAQQFKGKEWFVKITCPEVGRYIVHAKSWLVMDCVHAFESCQELIDWSKGW